MIVILLHDMEREGSRTTLMTASSGTKEEDHLKLVDCNRPGAIILSVTGYNSPSASAMHGNAFPAPWFPGISSVSCGMNWVHVETSLEAAVLMPI